MLKYLAPSYLIATVTFNFVEKIRRFLVSKFVDS
jgi:hypothetical protein